MYNAGCRDGVAKRCVRTWILSSDVHSFHTILIKRVMLRSDTERTSLTAYCCRLRSVSPIVQPHVTNELTYRET